MCAVLTAGLVDGGLWLTAAAASGASMPGPVCNCLACKLQVAECYSVAALPQLPTTPLRLGLSAQPVLTCDLEGGLCFPALQLHVSCSQPGLPQGIRQPAPITCNRMSEQQESTRMPSSPPPPPPCHVAIDGSDALSET